MTACPAHELRFPRSHHAAAKADEGLGPGSSAMDDDADDPSGQVVRELLRQAGGEIP